MNTCKAILDVPVTLSSIVRAAAALYVAHLDDLLAQIHRARADGVQVDLDARTMDGTELHPAIRALVLEKLHIRDANSGADAEIDLEQALAIEDGELPLYRDLAKAHRDQAAAARRAGLRIELDKTLGTFTPLRGAK